MVAFFIQYSKRKRMSIFDDRPQSRQHQMSKTIFRSTFAPKTSIIRNVRFDQDISQLLQQTILKKKQSQSATMNDALMRKCVKKNTFVKCNRRIRHSQKNQQLIKTLNKLESLQLPTTIRKFYGQTNKIISKLLNSPILTRNSIMNEYKCFMSNFSTQDSHLIPKKLMVKAKERLQYVNNLNQFNFRYDVLGQFIKKIQQKCNDSIEFLQSFELVRKSQKYPPSVELMLLYIGIFLYEIHSSYQMAEDLCRNLLDLLIKYKLDEYILIYLILMIKMKSNLNEWQSALGYISKLLSASWVYKLQDLQIWCYFEFSRAYFSASNSEACEFFKERSEMSILQSQSIFREMMEKQYIKEIQLMKNHNYHFDLTNIIQFSQLTELPLKERQVSSLKAQVYAKTIIQNFKIKHVKNLIGRLGEDLNRSQQDLKYNKFGGNPHFLTHESGIKNLNIYFRQRETRGKPRNFYTFQSSNKNSLVLKQMLKYLLIEMRVFVGILD